MKDTILRVDGIQARGKQRTKYLHANTGVAVWPAHLEVFM